MSTSKAQRIGIWIIAVTLAVGTIGSFGVMILANENQRTDQADQAEMMEQLQQEQQRAAEERAANSQPLDGYEAEAFTAEDVTELETEILQAGDGATVQQTDTINVSYFGWLPSGEIFDSSQRDGEDTPADMPLSGVIPGWTEGLAGAEVGSVVQLTIPAEQAYGSQSSGIIPANTPLMFIVEIHNISQEQQ